MYTSWDKLPQPNATPPPPQSQRDSCLSELANDIPELSKQQYSHFIVLKLLKYCTSSKNKKDIVKSLKNQVVKLATHSVGAR